MKINMTDTELLIELYKPLEKEIDIYRRYKDFYGYGFYVAEKP